MPRAIAITTLGVIAAAVLLTGCGGDDSTTTNGGGATSTTTTGGGGASAACATYLLLQAAGEKVQKLEPGGATAARAAQAADSLSKSAQAFESAASKGGGQVKSDIAAAVDGFKLRADAAQGQPPDKRLAALGSAFEELQRQVGKPVDQLKCQ